MRKIALDELKVIEVPDEPERSSWAVEFARAASRAALRLNAAMPEASSRRSLQHGKVSTRVSRFVTVAEEWPVCIRPTRKGGPAPLRCLDQMMGWLRPAPACLEKVLTQLGCRIAKVVSTVSDDLSVPQHRNNTGPDGPRVAVPVCTKSVIKFWHDPIPAAQQARCLRFGIHPPMSAERD